MLHMLGPERMEAGVRRGTARIHKPLRVTPAMAGGLTDRLWEMRDIVALVEAAEAAEGPKKRGPYEPRQPRATA